VRATDDTTTAIVLAAGQGKRMRSRVAKVLHKAGGRPLLWHVLRALEPLQLGGGRIVVASPAVKQAVEAADWGDDVTCVLQDEARGTADAVRVALEGAGIAQGTVLVAQGGSPLVRTETLRALLEAHVSDEAAASILTAVVSDPSGYGRVLRDDSGAIEAIVEERDATEDQRSIQEINAGVYVFDVAKLAGVVARVGRDNDQGEYYLPDVIGYLRSEGEAIASQHADPAEILGVKSRMHLARVGAELRRRTAERLMVEGVTIVDPEVTYIDSSVEIEPDAVVYPFTFLEGDTTVAEGATIGPHARVTDSHVGAAATVTYSVVTGSSIGPRASVGPYASLRPGSVLAAGAKVGTFVETKQTTLGANSKANHLSYLGDAEIGEGVNIGAGTITCNWDGRTKHRTEIGDGAYISSDTMLVAPVRIGERAATGAGAVVREDVPEGALAVGVPARIIEGKGDRMRRSREHDGVHE
jgi:bifunctional UDP-N-acetylglucosamine pyrophosphorylase / glucosamine-1-phosphate N-acetyltransferase